MSERQTIISVGGSNYGKSFTNKSKWMKMREKFLATFPNIETKTIDIPYEEIETKKLNESNTNQ